MVMVNGREGVVQWFCPCTALERVNTWIWYFELFTSTVQHVTNSITEAHVPTRDVQNSFKMERDTASTCYLVGVMLMFSGGGIPSNYLVSTQLQFWLFCCWGCGCCWAVTKIGESLKTGDIIWDLQFFWRSPIFCRSKLETQFRVGPILWQLWNLRNFTNWRSPIISLIFWRFSNFREMFVLSL